MHQINREKDVWYYDGTLMERWELFHYKFRKHENWVRSFGEGSVWCKNREDFLKLLRYWSNDECEYVPI